MSQRELAEAVTAYVQRTTGRDVALDRHDISRWERGLRRCQTAEYREAIRAVLGVGSDGELGFYARQRAALSTHQPGRPEPRSTDEIRVGAVSRA